MKKLLWISAILLIVSATPAAAQLNFGLKAGMNLAQKPSTDFNELKESIKGSTGWFVGPSIKYTFPLLGLGVEADVLYSQTNVELEGQKILNQSVDIPLYLRFDIKLPVITPFIAIGPQFGWNIGDKEITLENIENEDYSKYTLSESDISLNLGLGFILFNHLQIHGNYNLALGRTAEVSNLDFSKVMELKTSKWQISLAYIF
ncbi:MAG: porin family protein [Bacteroidaceae bacterium]|nr:porin family protein [Bacteroidaceae bacterium]